MSGTAVSTQVKEYSFNELEQMALSMFESKFFGFTHKSQYLTLMLMAQAKGRNPVLVVEDYHFFEGKASPKADAVLTWHLASGGKVDWIQSSAEVVEAVFTGPDGTTFPSKWTIEDARKAGLANKKNWTNHPEDMLAARVIGRGVKRVNPGCLRGERLVEERMDEPDAPEDTAPRTEEPAAPSIPRASEMAAVQHADAVDAEHTPVEPTDPTEPAQAATPTAPAAAAAQPVQAAQRTAKAAAPAAPPQPPANAIRLKEVPTDVKEREGADRKIRYGIFFSVGVVGTFNKEAATKSAQAVKDGKPIDVAFTVKQVGTPPKDQRDLVWIEGEVVAQ